MNDRIDDFLEGTSPADALTPDERRHALALERAIDDVRGFVSARPAPDQTHDILQRLREAGPPAAHPRWHQLVTAILSLTWTPRPITVRPIYALAIAAALLVLPLAIAQRFGSPEPGRTGSESRAPVFVQFRLETEASRVQLAGSFTDWEPRYDLHPAGPGIWSVTVPLEAGVHDYAFVVDGEQWRADPYAAHIDDGFGGINSRLTLVRPEARAE